LKVISVIASFASQISRKSRKGSSCYSDAVQTSVERQSFTFYEVRTHINTQQSAVCKHNSFQMQANVRPRLTVILQLWRW